MKNLIESIRYDAGYNVACEGMHPFTAYLTAISAHIKWGIGALVCEITDHKWTDTSTVGPDSGDMDMTCDRCGYHFHHQLY